MGMLSFGPQSGYDIKRNIERSVRHFWNESYGQIYPILHRLVEEGLAVRRTERGEGRPDRHVYSLTPAGHAELEKWLVEPVESPPAVRHELLLKLFFGHLVGPEETRKHLVRYRDELERQLELYRSIESDFHAKNPDGACLPLLYGLLTLRCGLRVAQAYLEWSEEALEALATFASDAPPPADTEGKKS